MGRRFVQLIAVAVAALALTGAAAATDAYGATKKAPAVSAEFFSVGAQNLNIFTWHPSYKHLLGPHVERMKALGVKAVRVNQTWDSAQPREPNLLDGLLGGGYSWGTNDLLFRTLAAAGIRVDANLENAPAWAAEEPGCPGGRAPRAEQIAGFAAWAAAFAKRYGRNGDFWRAHPHLPYKPVLRYEIWNEPNLKRFWCPAPQPKRFAELTVQSAKAIRQVDPEATIIFAGLALPTSAPGARMEAGEFTRKALAHRPQIRNLVDEIGIHPYAGTADEVLARTAEMRAVMRALDFDKPFAVNEFGWVTNGPKKKIRLAGEQERAAQTRAIANRIWRTDCNIARIALHTWTTPQSNEGDTEDWYGVADWSSAQPFASARRYAEQLALATGSGDSAPPTKRLAICGGDSSSPPPPPAAGEPPETWLEKAPRRVGVRRPARIRLRARGHADGFICRIDGARWEECRSPYRLPRLDAGRHTLEVSAYSERNGIDQTPARHTFVVDDSGPQTTIKRKGKRRFVLGARQGDAARFRCRIDRRRWRDCPRRLRLRRLKSGRHVLRVRAIDRVGNPDTTPAKRRFRI